MTSHPSQGPGGNRHRLVHQNLRAVRIRLDLLSQLANQNSQVLNIVHLVGAPDFLEQLLVCHHEADVRCKNMKKLIFFAGQLQAFLAERGNTRLRRSEDTGQADLGASGLAAWQNAEARTLGGVSV